MSAAGGDTGLRLSRRQLLVIVLLAVGLGLLIGLGVWQLERRAWKLDLIQRVEERVGAEPLPAPGPEAWSAVAADSDEYRRVVVSGRFLSGETQVFGSSSLGNGVWVLVPFRSDRGFTLLINRGFLPSERRAEEQPPPAGSVTVVGLLRLSEPGGGFLRDNDPAQDRWYSRDVEAIATARGLGEVAPYFVDAEAGPDRDALPRGGLTVVAFPNNHLIYALTWFGLALLLAVAAFHAARRGGAGRDEPPQRATADKDEPPQRGGGRR